MKPVNVTALRQNLPNYLAMVERSERVSVTLRGRVIAEICPPTPATDQASAARARLIDSLIRYESPFESAVEQWDMNR